MRKKLLLIKAIDSLCQFDIPLAIKIKMSFYDQPRLEQMLKVAKAYKRIYGFVPNSGTHLKRKKAS